MKIAIAQTRPIKGNITENIERHLQLINLAVDDGASIIIFPELSLTGYEPTLANELAIDPEDHQMNIFQQISDNNEVVIGVGMPTTNEEGVCISLVIFQPQQPRQLYSKKYLHADEVPFFVKGTHHTDLKINDHNMALAICYEISIPEHSGDAFRRRAEFYLASVAKSVHGVDKALGQLATIAKRYSMTVLMSNSVGPADDFECGGNSSVWNKDGLLVGQLDNTSEGVLIFDTDSQTCSSFSQSGK